MSFWLNESNCLSTLICVKCWRRFFQGDNKNQLCYKKKVIKRIFMKFWTITSSCHPLILYWHHVQKKLMVMWISHRSPHALFWNLKFIRAIKSNCPCTSMDQATVHKSGLLLFYLDYFDIHHHDERRRLPRKCDSPALTIHSDSCSWSLTFKSTTIIHCYLFERCFL